MRLTRLLLALVLLALAAPASAQGVWSAPVTLSQPGQDAFGSHVGVDQSGNAVFVWQRRDGTTDCSGSGCFRIQARTRSAGGALGPVETLSAPGKHASIPQVAVDPNGNAVFVWQRPDETTGCGGSGCYQIKARARSAAGVLSATQTLSEPGQNAVDAQVAVDQSGNAVFVWQRPDGTSDCGLNTGCFRIQARARSATGVLSATQTLSDPGRSAFSPQVAVDQDGNAVFAWDRNDDTTDCPPSGIGCHRIQARARSARGKLSSVQTLSDRGRDAFRPQVAVDPNDNAVFAWGRMDETTDCSSGPEFSPGCFRIQARARSAKGKLSSVETLSDPGQDAFDPQVAVDPNGNAVFVWSRFDGTNSRIQAIARSATGVLSATQTLSAAGRDASSPQVAVDQSGNAVFVWERLGEGTGCAGSGCFRIQARVRSAAGVLSSTETLSDSGQDAFTPQVAVDPSGNAVVVWQRLDGGTGCGGVGCRLIQAATGP
jgi:uncharacterized protein YheU (UPF0270 family)